jgi:hypothetical protein
MDTKELISSITNQMEIVYESIDYKTKNYFHTVLQRKLKDLSVKYELFGETEYKVHQIDGMKGKKGFIDVVWNKNNKLLVAIEHDSTFREKSIRKLTSSKAEKMVYIYYGSKNEQEISQRIKSIDVSDDIIIICKSYKLGLNKDFGITKEYYL